MISACDRGHLSVCEWLVLNGALNQSTSSSTHQFRSGDHLIMRLVGSFLGVEVGRRLRNVREFAEALGGAQKKGTSS